MRYREEVQCCFWPHPALGCESVGAVLSMRAALGKYSPQPLVEASVSTRGSAQPQAISFSLLLEP